MLLKTYEKIKTNALIENNYNMPLINNKLGYFINILNFIHQITFSIIIKVGFLIKGVIKIYFLQEFLSKFVISKLIFELFVNLIVLVETLCAPDYVR